MVEGLSPFRSKAAEQGRTVDIWTDVLQNLIAYGATLLVAVLLGLALFFFLPRIRKTFWPLPRLRRGNWNGFDVFVCYVILTELTSLVRELLGNVGFFEAVFDKPASP